MDQLFDLLVEPVDDETIGFVEEKLPHKFPDKYRPYLFNLPNFKINEDYQINADITNTNVELWKMPISDLIIKLTKHCNKNYRLQQHTIGHFVKNPTKFSKKINKYYYKLYNLLDIIICRSNENEIVQIIAILLNESNQRILIRFSFYISVYFICINRYQLKKILQKLKDKIIEFKKEKIINEFFVESDNESELDDYMKYLMEKPSFIHK
jgi:hypothetical protein